MVSPPIERFFEACEASPPLRLRGAHRRPDGTSGAFRTWDLTAPFAIVGSDPRVDLWLDDPLVSPRHCLLQALGSRVLAIDLGSDRGLFDPGGSCLASWIEPGKDLRIGGHMLSLCPSTAVPARIGGDSAPLFAGRLPKAVLEIRAGRLRTRWSMRGAIVLVGSDRACALRLSGSGIARFHAALLRTRKGLWAIDLLGAVEGTAAGGIGINGRPARFAALGEADVLQIGDFRVSLRAHAPRIDLSGIEEEEAARPGGRRVVPVASPSEPSVVPDEPRPATFAAELLRLIDRQCQEIAALRRDVDRLRGQLDSALNRSQPREGLQRPDDEALHTARGRAIRNVASRRLGYAVRCLRPSLSPPPADLKSHLGSQAVVAALEPDGTALARSEPSDAMALF